MTRSIAGLSSRVEYRLSPCNPLITDEAACRIKILKRAININPSPTDKLTRMTNPLRLPQRMRIQKKHLYHGCALAQIVEHRGFTSLHIEKSVDKASDTYGHYCINRATHLFIKYRSKGEDAQEWGFSFKAEEVKRILQCSKKATQCFVALVCAPKEVCLLDISQLRQLISFRVRSNDQRITASLKPRCGFAVVGDKGQLSQKVRRNRFPKAVLTTTLRSKAA